MEQKDALRGALNAALAWWRGSEPGTDERRKHADEIERIEAELFGDAPHARGRAQKG